MTERHIDDDEWSDKLVAIAQSELDTEEQHCEADRILCELLTSLGFHRTVHEFMEIEKWYS